MQPVDTMGRVDARRSANSLDDASGAMRVEASPGAPGGVLPVHRNGLLLCYRAPRCERVGTLLRTPTIRGAQLRPITVCRGRRL
jgi:hypothetical protein